MSGGKGLTWPMVVLAGVVVAGMVALFAVIPADDGASRSAVIMLLSAVGTALTTWVTTRKVHEVREQVAHVERQVNGRMSQLIEKKTLPDDGGGDGGVVPQSSADQLPGGGRRPISGPLPYIGRHDR